MLTTQMLRQFHSRLLQTHSHKGHYWQHMQKEIVWSQQFFNFWGSSTIKTHRWQELFRPRCCPFVLCLICGTNELCASTSRESSCDCCLEWWCNNPSLERRVGTIQGGGSRFPGESRPTAVVETARRTVSSAICRKNCHHRSTIISFGWACFFFLLLESAVSHKQVRTF